MKIKHKVAVITGGNSGIGLATAEEFKAQGARVVVFGRSRNTLDVADKTIGGRYYDGRVHFDAELSHRV